MKTTLPITLPKTKPRNPLVAASLHRSAGSHRKSNAVQRQRAARELQRELKHTAQRATEHGPPQA
jgi:hypothetical protein